MDFLNDPSLLCLVLRVTDRGVLHETFILKGMESKDAHPLPLIPQSTRLGKPSGSTDEFEVGSVDLRSVVFEVWVSLFTIDGEIPVCS